MNHHLTHKTSTGSYNSRSVSCAVSPWISVFSDFGSEKDKSQRYKPSLLESWLHLIAVYS
ncbi:MAG: hypothetical protein KGH85_08480 [Thaumarchaeota archaeon]|nr:hypothetical protein [Nitrososphaerota archaeon]